MKFSHYQQAIFQHVKTRVQNIFKGSDHAICPAGPGSGKTTTIVEATKEIPTMMSCLVGSFNNHIAAALSNRVRPHQSATLNAMGWRACKAYDKSIVLVKFKTANILKQALNNDDQFYKLKGATERVISLLKAEVCDPSDCINRIDDIIARHCIDVPKILGINFNETVKYVYSESCHNVYEMDFDDQKFMPIYYNWPLPTFDYLMIDEAQDLSPLDTELCKRMIKRFSIFVGDPFQCQPPGTMVDVVIPKSEWNKLEVIKKPIEELKAGMTVVSWSSSDRQWRRNKQITKVSYRHYNGDLIVVKTKDGKISKYTPNHKCIVNFSDLGNSWCVYLMKKNSNYRIGMTKISYSGSCIGNGLARRVRAEEADAIWLLDIYDTNREAWIQEQIISNTFNIPQLLFKSGNASVTTQNDIDYAWNKIGDNEINAIKCLEYYGRLLKYPLFSKENRNWEFGLKRPMKTQACNLINGILVLPYEHGSENLYHKDGYRLGHTYSYDWISTTVSREYYEGLVYSLNIDQDHTYVADGITTSNSCYLFRGADPYSMDKIKEQFNCDTLPLNICYRCPDAVIEEIQKINPDIEKPNPNPNGRGIVDQITKQEFRKIVLEGDFVLCRTTAPLVKECLKFFGEGRYAYVKGRDIGQKLTERIDKIEPDNCSIVTFNDKVDKYYTQESATLSSLNREYQLSELQDQIDSIRALMPRCTDVRGMRLLIEDMIPSDEEGRGICFMTLHRSKGLETKNVFILRRDLIPHSKAKTDEQLIQERNLLLIGVSRAQYALRYVLKEAGEK